jgi:hypothetical protein
MIFRTAALTDEISTNAPQTAMKRRQCPADWVNAPRDVRAAPERAVRCIDADFPPEAIDEWRGTTHPIVLDSTAVAAV